MQTVVLFPAMLMNNFLVIDIILTSFTFELLQYNECSFVTINTTAYTSIRLVYISEVLKNWRHKM